MLRMKLALAVSVALLPVALLAAPAVAAPPANDGYLQSIRINDPATKLPRQQVKDLKDTREATTQADLFSPPASGGGAETTRCGPTAYGRTVWYDFTADQFGTAEVQAAGYDGVVTVYEFDPKTARIGKVVACSSEPGVTEDLFVPVRKGGSYTIQIGGVDAGTGLGPVGGDLQLTFEFFPDRDRDGVFDALDKCPTQAGDQGEAGCPPELRSNPKVRAMPTATGVRILTLNVTAPKGARVEVRCQRGCATKQVRRALKRGTLAFSKFRNRDLSAGAVVEVRVTASRSVGNYYRYTISRGNFKRAERCLAPGSTKPKKCS